MLDILVKNPADISSKGAALSNCNIGITGFPIVFPWASVAHRPKSNISRSKCYRIPRVNAGSHDQNLDSEEIKKDAQKPGQQLSVLFSSVGTEDEVIGSVLARQNHWTRTHLTYRVRSRV